MNRCWIMLLAAALLACQQTAQTGTASNAPQSAIEVKSQVQTLSLTGLSDGLNNPETLASGNSATENAAPESTALDNTTLENTTLAQAFLHKQSHVWLQGHGEVVKLLADDTQGARHQRFLLRVSAEQTLLFAHNIDLAPRAEVNIGDQVQFKGEYIYNPKGGILHWTHHDPQGREGGWIKHNGQTYE